VGQDEGGDEAKTGLAPALHGTWRLRNIVRMATDARDVVSGRALVEQEAEHLVVHQLDLLAQLERQLRAVRLTMRRIEKLRGAQNRIGDELSNGQKLDTLDHLADEVHVIDRELQTQHESCQLMLATVEKMRERLRPLRQASGGAVTGTQYLDSPRSSMRNRRRKSATQR
jgi:enoyl-CoA hydratase/carnithine racemase